MKLKLSFVLALAAFTLALVIDLLFFKSPELGVNMPLAELAFLSISLWLAKSQGTTITRSTYIAAGFALAFATTFAIWNSSWSLPMDFLGFLVANTLFAAFLLGETDRFRHPLDVAYHLVVVPAKHALFALPFVRTLVPEKASTHTRTVIKGVVIALPILLVFVLMLAGADPVFASYVGDIIAQLNRWLSIPNVIGHAVFIGFFFTLFCAFFAAAFWSKKTFTRSSSDATPRATLESKIILGSVAALFALFLLVSGVALFGGSAGLTHLNITYAEYARQGFGQLCAVVVLVLGLVMTLRVLHTETTDRVLTMLQMALLAESALMLISAFMRLGLYIGAFGYTPARLFGLWFFGMVGIFLLVTTVHIVMRRNQSALIPQLLVLTAIGILAFTALGPDALARSLNAKRNDLTLEDTLDNLTPYHPDTWQSWNYTRSIAK